MKTILLLALSLFCMGANASTYETEATQWLKLIDSQLYEESWGEADPFFQTQITLAEWVRQANKARAPFGKLISRKIKSAEEYSELPGAPDGEYMVISYQSVFENKKNAVETLTLSKSTAVWKVVGYFIR